MSGTLVRDALAAELFDATVASDTTTTGTAVHVAHPHLVGIEAVVSGSGIGSLDIEIQGADNSDFDEGVVSYGHFDAIADADTRFLNAYVAKAYMRAVVVSTGTTTDADIVVTVREPHDRRTPSTTA
jgi:hypothetical protein